MVIVQKVRYYYCASSMCPGQECVNHVVQGTQEREKGVRNGKEK